MRCSPAFPADPGRRHFLCACGCCGLGLLLSGAARGEQSYLVPPRFAHPAADSEEGGLWALLDREEARLKRSRFLERDRELQEYLRGVACKLAGEHCADLRLYVLRTPFFNASMAPNGMMQVWTGLLLRMANEAQLAAVLGHEIAHYLAKHTLERLRDAKSRSAFGQFLGLALNAAGAGGAGSLAELVTAAGMFAFTRDQEREADRIGLDLMVRAGYEPMEASRVWAQLLAELKAESDWTGQPEKRSVLFASHPDSQERQAALAEQANALSAQAHDLGLAPWQAVMAPRRKSLLEDELKRRRSGETLALMQRLIEAEPGDGELRVFLGEAYRQRAAEGDEQRALDAYAAAESRSNAPPDLYRSRGLVLKARGDDAGAREAFRHYLQQRPDAADAALIKSYVEGDGTP